MGKVSGVEWSGPTWNPWHGCHKKSPGCKFCYMYREKRRYGQDPHLVVRSKTTFNDPLKWAKAVAGGAPLEDYDDIFTCSWSDFFNPEADAWRPEAWSIIRRTPFRYLIVTKEAMRIEQSLPPDWGNGYPNVLLIVSVENEDYTWRIPMLQKVPCIAGRGVSLGPLLGPVEIGRYLVDYTSSDRISHIMPPTFFPKLDWAILEGESGDPKEDVRPMSLDWVRPIRDACIETQTPFYFKQWGEWAPIDERGRPGTGEPGCFFARIGRDAAGRLLDGREWNEKPPRRDVPILATREMFA